MDFFMRKSFLGIYASNTLPPLGPHLTSPIGIICNTEESGKEGSHWVLVWASPPLITGGKTLVYYIDSLCKSPLSSSKYIAQWLGRFKNSKIMKLQAPIQSAKSSKLCGLYVLYFLYHLSHGATNLRAIEKHFYRDAKRLKFNDQIVRSFFWKKFKFHISKL